MQIIVEGLDLLGKFLFFIFLIVFIIYKLIKDILNRRWFSP